MNNFLSLFGFDDTTSFVKSTFQVDQLVYTLPYSGFMTFLSVWLESLFGINFTILAVLLALFTMEVITGTRASLKEGNPLSSRRMGAGYIKLFCYMVMIGSAHLLSVNMPKEIFFGFEMDVYHWLHLGFLHYVFISLFISLLENFARLGWDDYIPILKKINSKLNIDKKEEKGSHIKS